MRLSDIELTERVTGERILPPAPYEPVCDTCGGDGVVRVWSGRENDRMPCPDCVMGGAA